MQQSYTNLSNTNPRRGKQFVNMLAGMLHATTFGALWYGLATPHTFALLVGAVGVVLGLFHLWLEYRRGLNSYRRAVAKQHDENIKQEIARLTQQRSPAQPSHARQPYQRYPASRRPYPTYYNKHH